MRYSQIWSFWFLFVLSKPFLCYSFRIISREQMVIPSRCMSSYSASAQSLVFLLSIEVLCPAKVASMEMTEHRLTDDQGCKEDKVNRMLSGQGIDTLARDGLDGSKQEQYILWRSLM